MSNVFSKKQRRFLVIDIPQLILVEPDSRKLGWGLVKFVGLLQDVEVTGDKEDSRSLFVTIHKPSSSALSRPRPLISAKFVFDDHIRCMAAKQRLIKGRAKARQRDSYFPSFAALCCQTRCGGSLDRDCAPDDFCLQSPTNNNS